MQTVLSNFALILFILMVVTGVLWLLDRFIWAKQRRAQADVALAEYDARQAWIGSLDTRSGAIGRD